MDDPGVPFVVIDEEPDYLNPPGLDDVDLWRGIIANVPTVALGTGLRALGRRMVAPAVRGAAAWAGLDRLGLQDRIQAGFDLAGDLVDIPYEALLDELAASHGSKVPPRHDSWLGDLLASGARNIGKMLLGERF